MNYDKIYNNIITNRKNNPYFGYTENHHILPRSLGGSDNIENTVSLSAREHFICHLLLTKIYKNDCVAYKKMVKAFIMMLCCKSDNQDRYITSKEFSLLREQFSLIQKETQKGELNSQHGSKWIHNDLTREIKKLRFGENLPEGWEYGKSFDIGKNTILINEANQRKLDLKKERFKKWYDIYKNVGFDEFVVLTGYNKSKQNLVQQFNKYADDFLPQNGKKRKNTSV